MEKDLSLSMIFLSVVLIGLITWKLKVLNQKLNEIKMIESNLRVLVEEHSELLTVLLDELEEKLAEGNKVIKYFEDNTFALPEQEMSLPIPALKKKPAKGKLEAKNYLNMHESPQVSNPDIQHLADQGLSTKEIAEKLNITQGEVALKLNLFKRKNS